MKINEDLIRFHGQDLIDMLIKKNQDYGNSVQEQFEEYGIDSILIRLDDKMRRLKTLRTHNPQVVEESLKDTLKDLSGYALLGLICLVHEEKKSYPKMCGYCGKTLFNETGGTTSLGGIVCSTDCGENYVSYKLGKKPGYADLDDE